MKTQYRHPAFTVALALLVAQVAGAQPEIALHGIVNNASFSPYGLRNYGIAQGSVFAIFGKNLGPDGLAKAKSFPLGKELAGTSVQVISGNATYDALPLYVTPTQVGALLPSNTPVSDAKVTVTYQGRTSAPVSTWVARRNFGAFSVDQSGAGPAIATNFISEKSQPLNTPLTPAKPGQVVTIWGTGMGPVKGDEAAGPLPGDIDLPSQFFVTVNGLGAKAMYKGRSGCCAGIDQIAIEVPAGVEGCYLPVHIEVGQFPSIIGTSIWHEEGSGTQSVTIAVTPDGAPCSDPLGLTSDELQAMQARNSLRLGWLWLANTKQGVNASAMFARFDPGSFLARPGVFGLPAPGGFGLAISSEPGGTGWPVPETLDAGILTLSGAGVTRTFSRDPGGAYQLKVAQLAPGSYTLANGQGGRDVGSFTASFDVPALVDWMNPGPPGAGYAPTWRNRDPDTFVFRYDVVANSGWRLLPRQITAAADGRFAYVGGFLDSRRSMMTAPLYRGDFGTLFGETFLSLLKPVRFTAPGLDAGIIAPLNFDSRSVVY